MKIRIEIKVSCETHRGTFSYHYFLFYLFFHSKFKNCTIFTMFEEPYVEKDESPSYGIELEVYLETSDLFMRSTEGNLPLFEIEASYQKGKANEIISAIENEDLENESVIGLFSGIDQKKLEAVPCIITDSRYGNVTTKTVILRRKVKDFNGDNSDSSESRECESEPVISSSDDAD
ncbi:hypothetical protein TRFO_40267 [Tritrichomonas foetus]|uniref:Uncharacterized protein n=1 Tax=Tritrichomonas foetus TaxID=1144522 RepID=A0A1J4J7R9_9EUKA|nr:hypothetical protein TRFO_40267 [Tritrichomonas foetus]|eukprot:OHS93461.1 hypothetical protein TRFO_40267 [Tritrichomonas foetus]